MSQIKEAVDAAMRRFNQKHDLAAFEDREVYANWLAQTYFFVRHSTTLLGYALPHLKHEKLRRHFEHHLGEEEKHDLLLLKDLEKLGRSIDEFKESHLTSAFYQSQYYRIAFEGGTSMLGYILFLECLATDWGKSCYHRIAPIYSKSTLFLKVHAEEDPHHVVEAIRTIEALSDEEQVVILRNLEYSEFIYDEMMSYVKAQRTAEKKAA
jgi:pyrroloquinoline quinone (PQQ) biosynthesis protein C